jgi:methanogenic corrinoid protein MtbC1
MQEPMPNLPPVDPARADEPFAAATFTPDLLASLLADGDDELAAWTLRNALAEQGRAVAFDGLLRDAMRLVGERWSTGRWTVAEEHLASQTLLRALERIRPPAGPESRVGPLAVLAGVAGEHHGLGLACLEQVLCDDGWSVSNLGPDVPAADLARFLARNRADLLALSASLSEREPAILDAVAAARAARADRPLPIMLGGPIVADPAVAARVDVDFRAGSLVEAARFARTVADAVPERDLDRAPAEPDLSELGSTR